MSVTQKAQQHFGAPSITIRGTKHLWGRSFKRRFDLSDPKQAEIALRTHARHVLHTNLLKEGRQHSDANPTRWPTAQHWYFEVVMEGNQDHKMRNPTTFFKITKHRK